MGEKVERNKIKSAAKAYYYHDLQRNKNFSAHCTASQHEHLSVFLRNSRHMPHVIFPCDSRSLKDYDDHIHSYTPELVQAVACYLFQRWFLCAWAESAKGTYLQSILHPKHYKLISTRKTENKQQRCRRISIILSLMSSHRTSRS